MAAMSTRAGTQVVSCISTRPGTNGISASLAPLASHPRMAALAASPSEPVPLRSTFSSSSRMSQGRRARSAPALAGRSTKRSRRPLCGKDWMDVVLIAASLAPHQRVYAIFAYKQQEKQQCILQNLVDRVGAALSFRGGPNGSGLGRPDDRLRAEPGTYDWVTRVAPASGFRVRAFGAPRNDSRVKPYAWSDHVPHRSRDPFGPSWF